MQVDTLQRTYLASIPHSKRKERPVSGSISQPAFFDLIRGDSVWFYQERGR